MALGGGGGVVAGSHKSLLRDSLDTWSLWVCTGSGRSCSKWSPSISQYMEHFTVQFG